MKVVYGHTDSIYVDIEDNSIETAKQTLKILNDHVREAFPNVMGLEEHPVTLEFEKYFRTLGVGATKNRNAGLITWKDGDFLDEEEFTMTGFTAKRVSLTKLAKEVQLAVLNMWVEGKSEEDLVSYLNVKYNNVMRGNIPLTDVLQRSRYREERFQVVCKTCNPKARFDKGWKNKSISVFDLMAHGGCIDDNGRVMEHNNFVTVGGKRPTFGSGVEGVLFSHSQGYEKIEDTYLYLRIKDCRENYLHPLTRQFTTPNYVSRLTASEFGDFTPDWEHYAESVVKKAEPIFRAMGWNIQQIRKDSQQTSLEDWF